MMPDVGGDEMGSTPESETKQRPPKLLTNQSSFTIGETPSPLSLERYGSNEDDWWFSPDSLRDPQSDTLICTIENVASVRQEEEDPTSDTELDANQMDDPTGLWLNNKRVPMGIKVLDKVLVYAKQIDTALKEAHPLAEKFTNFSRRVGKEKIRKRMSRSEALAYNLQTEFAGLYTAVNEALQPLFEADRHLARLMKNK
eukprot:GHVN01102304.1.p1 GENE.GHVN01102304.1~~GHVN01102304.1.p1  ORF type:complete len:199 (+),score=41.17 GHVN01102304.1:952-1548(+)